MLELKLEKEVYYINLYEILYVNGYKDGDGIYNIDIWFKRDTSPLTIEYDNESEFSYDINSIKNKLNEIY